MEENIENGLECGQPHCLTLAESQGTGQRGILIQLTGTEGEWDSLDESNLVVTLDYGEEVPTASHIEEALREEDFGLRSPAFHVPLSPSSPSSLGDSCVSGPSLLSPHLNPGPATPISRPFVNLVKSLSTEIESKDASSLRSKPLLSLVKSISTEISRSDPEVSQSKSDSKLNLHLWKQLTQPKGRMGDCRTAPPSPGSLSPPEAKVGFFKAELEDTRRKFSEAMQEPLSMFSKIMGDESSGSPKHQKVAESPGSKGACGGGGKTNSDCVATETPSRNTRAAESDCDVPLRRPRRTLQKPCLSPWICTKLGSRGNKLEICTCGDIIQVMEFAGREPVPGLPGDLVSERPPPPVPDKRLLLVAVLTYSYLILPLPSYLSGLSLGLACGFMLGLLLVLLVTPRHSARTERRVHTLEESSQSEIFCREHKDPDVLKGWMNEVYEYDPDTFNPTLTHSVYASLEGSCLQLAYPRTNAPRWATVHEPPIEAAFISSRRYQLANSKVFLLPRFLARKRVWNKKYPICVVLAEGEEGVVEEGTEPLEGEQSPGLQRPSAQPGRPTSLYLFGRTGRAKEEWFQHLMAASASEDKDNHSRHGSKIGVSPPCGSSPASLAQCCGDSTRGSTEDIPSRLQPRDLVVGVSRTILLDYHSYVARLVASETGSPLSSPCYSAEGSPTTKRKLLCKCWGGHTEAQTAWINALIGRTFWDFLREKYWADQVARKIQKKLSKIRLPYFMDELTLTELDMGTCMPQVASISKPSANHKGLWLELELVYTGSLQMTLETKMNLSKLGKDGEAKADAIPETGSVTSRPRAGVLADSDEESSSAGSSDDEEVPASELPGCAGDKGTAASTEGYGGGRTSRKILRLVDKIAKSKYFQKATENEFIKKKIEEVSNTPLLLTVEVQELSGTLAINIPPPPTDRIWYSFCVPPKLDLRVRPKLGEREVTLTHITEWIEKKLQREFEKVFVMPNMDDLYLPLMHSGLDSPPTSKQSLAQSRRSSVESLEKPGQENAFESEQCLLVEMGANTL